MRQSRGTRIAARSQLIASSKRSKKALDQICADPGRFPRRGSRYRFARVKKFPYIVAFTLEGGVISIATIRHTSRSNLDLDA
jgi:hypothetical protein